MSERKLATIEAILAIEPIEGADAIERALVRGWTVVVRKGQFQPGDRCVYLEIDSFLPVDEQSPFAFLAPRGVRTMLLDGREIKGHALRTAKLRSVVSQGLVLPVAEVGRLIGAVVELGDDVTEALGIVKWEPPLPAGGQGDIAGPFPTHLAGKTDAERVQNLGDEAFAVLRTATTWVPTEKIDGTSMTVARDPDGRLIVAGRNWEIRDGDNLYWDAVRAHVLADLVASGEALQAEVYGEGIQANPLKVRGVHVAVFGLWRDRTPIEFDQWPTALRTLAPPIVPGLTLADTVAEAVAQVNGMRSVISPAQLAEGVVWHAQTRASFRELDGRASFKVVSNAWLLKHGG